MFLNLKSLKKFVIFIGLIQFVSIKSMEIKLSSKDKDKKEFTVDKEKIVALSGLVRTSLEADASATEVPILGVASRELGFIAGNINNIYGQNEEQIDKSLSDLINKLSDEELIELINAANYMDIPLLLNVLIKKFAARLVKDKSKMGLVEKLFFGALQRTILKAIEDVQKNLNNALIKAITNDYNRLQKSENEITNEFLELVQLGADVNVKSNSAFSYATPLIIAAQKNYIEIVKILIAVGANLNIVNMWGDSALKIAKGAAGGHHIANLLKEAGARDF